MNDSSSAESLTRTWIHCWNDGEPERIPLAEDFTHTSPFGRVRGRKEYLEWVKPLARKNVTKLAVLRTLSSGDEAVVHFEMSTPQGPVQVCDWIAIVDGLITEVHSFYDATGLR